MTASSPFVTVSVRLPAHPHRPYEREGDREIGPLFWNTKLTMSHVCEPRVPPLVWESPGRAGPKWAEGARWVPLGG